MNESNKKLIPILTLVTYLLMVLVNALANIIPINNITTGELSDSYPNLFAPIGFTFSIWGLIYLLLLIYTIYQFKYYKTDSSLKDIFSRIGLLFIVSNIANTFWILAWHFRYIGLSVFLMLAILLTLILINMSLKNKQLTFTEKICIKLPFSVYFGWITVATVANITTFLVSISWTRLGLTEELWTVIILVVAALIGSAASIRFKSIPYGLVIIWAYVGIMAKHISPQFFNKDYIAVIITLSLMIALLVLSQLYVVKTYLTKKKS